MTSPFHIKEHVISAAHVREYTHATAVSQEDELKVHVKQYTPKDNPDPQQGDITVIGAHANGFPKEIYEPLWEELYDELKKKGMRLRSIWIPDAAWQGQSGILNEGKIGNDPCWHDGARDLSHLINTFRMPRPLIAIGHSMGANMLTNVALSHPRLFTTLILLDPVIARNAGAPGPISQSGAALSVNRRDTWPSREAALASYRKSPFYQAWDERVLDRWVKYGLRDVSGGSQEVKLATSRDQEVFTFLRPSWDAYAKDGKKLVNLDAAPDLNRDLDPDLWPTYPFYRPELPSTWFRLPNLRPGVLYIFGGRSDLSPPELRQEKLDVTGVGTGGSGGAPAGRVRAVTSEGNGHMIAQEAPAFCARQISWWVEAEMGRWWIEQWEFEEWTRRPAGERTVVGDDWRKFLGKPKRGAGSRKTGAPKL